MDGLYIVVVVVVVVQGLGLGEGLHVLSLFFPPPPSPRSDITSLGIKSKTKIDEIIISSFDSKKAEVSIDID